MNILAGNNISLRALEPSDVDLLYDWENNSSVWNVSNTLAPFSRYILEKYVANSHVDIFQAKQLRLMIDYEAPEKKLTVGAIDLFDFDPLHSRAGVGILINDRSYRNRGIASEALKILINYAFDILQLHQLYCNIDSDNLASIRLFEKSGFVITGEKKEWIKTTSGWTDEVMLQLINVQV